MRLGVIGLGWMGRNIVRRLRAGPGNRGGRWAVKAAIGVAVPAPVLSAALLARFASRGENDFANRLPYAMRGAFRGHAEEVVNQQAR